LYQPNSLCEGMKAGSWNCHAACVHTHLDF